MIQTVIKNQNDTVFYRTAPCNGVKMCTISGCTYVAPIREKRPCPHHKISFVKTDSCPVEFVYVYPADRQDKRRWIGGIVRHQKDLSKNLHNHVPPSETKIAQCVKEINKAIASNPTLTASDISLGKGLGFVPCAVDVASSHLGRVSKVVHGLLYIRLCMFPTWPSNKKASFKFHSKLNHAFYCGLLDCIWGNQPL